MPPPQPGGMASNPFVVVGSVKEIFTLGSLDV